METIAIGGRKIKDLPSATILNDTDDFVVENDTPKTYRIQWGTIFDAIKEKMTNFDTTIYTETISNWTVKYFHISKTQVYVEISRTFLSSGIGSRGFTTIIDNALPICVANSVYLNGIMHVGGAPVGQAWMNISEKTVQVANSTYNADVTICCSGIVLVQ